MTDTNDLPARLLVRDLMSVGVATCPPAAPLVDVARLMLEKQLEAVVVVDAIGEAVGVVTQDEMAQAYSHDDWRELTAEVVMRVQVPEIPADIPLPVAAQIMRDQGVRVVYIMHESAGVHYPAAALTYWHLLRHLAARTDADLHDLGTAAARKAPLASFIERRDAARRRGATNNAHIADGDSPNAANRSQNNEE